MLKIKERMVEKYNTYVEEENRKWNHGLKKVDSFEELLDDAQLKAPDR